MFTFLFIQLHIPLYNVLPEAFVVVYKHVRKYDQSLPVTETSYLKSFMLIYDFFFELWVLNLNEKEEDKKKKMKNSAHHSPVHL